MSMLDERKIKRIEVGIPSDVSARDEETLYIGAAEDSGIALGSTTVVPSSSPSNDDRIVSIDAFASHLSAIEGKYDNFNTSITSQINSVNSRLDTANSDLTNIKGYLGGTDIDLLRVKVINLTSIVSGKGPISAGSTANYSANIYTITDMNKDSWIALGVVGWYIYNSNTLMLQRCYLDNGDLKFSFSNKSSSAFTFATSGTLFTVRVLFVKRRIIPQSGADGGEF